MLTKLASHAIISRLRFSKQELTFHSENDREHYPPIKNPTYGTSLGAGPLKLPSQMQPKFRDSWRIAWWCCKTYAIEKWWRRQNLALGLSPAIKRLGLVQRLNFSNYLFTRKQNAGEGGLLLAKLIKVNKSWTFLQAVSSSLSKILLLWSGIPRFSLKKYLQDKHLFSKGLLSLTKGISWRF